MKVSKQWLKELVKLDTSFEEVIKLINLKTIGTKEVTKDFIELDMKGHHRADLLSMRGVALEVAALTNSEVSFDNNQEPKFDFSLPNLEIRIEDEKLCPLYSLTKIEGLKVGPSPKEWVKKLEDCGMRSVNNIADVTNLVMLEFGQPLHSFDSRTVKDEEIIIRTAKSGEKIETLDGKVRELEDYDLLITDREKNLGLAGVMGGKNSEVTDSTTAILLEAAIFDPANLRKTSARLNLISEAGKRFYHGLTKRRLYQALERAIELYKELGGEVTALTIEDHLEEKPKVVRLTLQKAVSLIGVKITPEEIEKYLLRLNFVPKGVEDGVWEVEVPYYRLDIAIEEDLIEEIARMYGYEKIPPKELEGSTPERIDQSLFELIYNLKKALVEEGLIEVQTYSFYSTEVLNNLSWAPDNLNKLVKIANPISAETEYMRVVLWPNLVEVVAKNIRKGYEDIAIFEIGKMYEPIKNEAPKEGYDLSLALMNGEDNPIEELYTILKRVFKKVGIDLAPGDQERGVIENMLFHPTRVQHLDSEDKHISGIAEVHPRIVNKFGVEKRIAIAEISIEELI